MLLGFSLIPIYREAHGFSRYPLKTALDADAVIKSPAMLSAYRHLLRYAGEIGSLYNVIQDPTHQVSMRLKLGILSDHNGTYIVRPQPLSSPQCADMTVLPLSKIYVAGRAACHALLCLLSRKP